MDAKMRAALLGPIEVAVKMMLGEMVYARMGKGYSIKFVKKRAAGKHTIDV